MSARQHQHMSRREAREYERKLAAERELREAIEQREVSSASDAGSASEPSSAPASAPTEAESTDRASVAPSAPSDEAARPAVPQDSTAPSTAASAGAPMSMASAPFFVNGQPMTRRQLRELRRAQEAGAVPPLVEPGEHEPAARGPLAPVELPEVPNVSTGSAPVMPAPVTSRPSNTSPQRAAAGDADAGTADAAASVTSGAEAGPSDAGEAPVRRRDRLRPSAVSAGFARSTESAASAEAPVIEPQPSSTPESQQLIESTPFASDARQAAAPANETVPEIVERSPFARAEPTAREADAPSAAASEGEQDAAHDTDLRERSTAFDSMVSPEAGGSTVSAAALVLPSVPGHSDLPRALDGTGEIIITDSIRLSGGLAATGSHSTGLDGIELDRLLDADDRAASQAVSDSQPVRASKAISTSSATRGVIQTKKPRGNKLLTGLAITASGLAVGVVALLVIGVLNGVF
ncbi:hypothetical protein [Ruicaihuangia caeni]|uniref:hypothetical protein n=1 Tax=Ruicaihuangia caeni TaxID=3042517 RepID=UPI00338F23B6